MVERRGEFFRKREWKSVRYGYRSEYVMWRVIRLRDCVKGL